MLFINKMLKIFLVLFSVSYITTLYAFTPNSPVGYWKTIDDVTGQPKSIMHIYANQDQTLSGRVVKIFPKPGEDQNKLCVACTGDKHNQKIVGMVVLEGMKADGNKWDDGQILDPKSGKTYRCNFTLTQDGTRLEVRGYIGISAFGRSQTWVRVK